MILAGVQPRQNSGDTVTSPPEQTRDSATIGVPVESVEEQPRVRGEKAPEPRATHTARGSTPHARGKGRVPPRARSELRINPTYAGKSGPVTPALHRARDQPRIRGEKRGLAQQVHGLQGSTPHTRGKVRRNVRLSLPNRINPAYAGKVDEPAAYFVRPGINPAYAGKRLSYLRVSDRTIEFSTNLHHTC